MNTEYQVIDLLCTLKSNLCYLDEKTYKDICAVLDCAITLLENQSVKNIVSKTFRSVKDMTIEEIMNGVINLLSELNCLSDTDEDIDVAKRKVMEVAENIYYK